LKAGFESAVEMSPFRFESANLLRLSNRPQTCNEAEIFFPRQVVRDRYGNPSAYGRITGKTPTTARNGIANRLSEERK